MNLRVKKWKMSKREIIPFILYSVVLTAVFFLPLAFSFSVMGVIFAEFFFISVGWLLHSVFGKKQGVNELIVFRFGVLNICLVIISYVTISLTIGFISIFAGIPAIIAVAGLHQYKIR